MPEPQEQLLRHLNELGAPGWVEEKLWEGFYHDYLSPHPMPKMLLVKDARMLIDSGEIDRMQGKTLIENVKDGEYDETAEE